MWARPDLEASGRRTGYRRNLMNEAIAVIGTGQAGLSCVARLREGGHTGLITMVGDEPHAPYQRPPLSKAYLLGKTARESLFFRADDYFANNGINLRLNSRAIAIDRDRRSVTLEDGDVLPYDRLVIATGSRARLLPDLDGVIGVHVLRSIEDTERLQGALAHAAHVVVVGGGYVGLEAASSCVAKGHEVTLVEAGPRILNRVACQETASLVAAIHRDKGVSIHTGTSVASIDVVDGKVTGVRLTDGRQIETNLVIVGIGGVANSELARDCGLHVESGIVVDEAGRTSDPNVFAAGDCACTRIEGAFVRIESVQNAVDQAQAVADTILGRPQAAGVVPWFWSDQYDCKLQTVGLPTNYDDVAGRSDRDGSSCVWYLRANRVVAVDTLNDGRTHLATKRLMAAGIAISALQVRDPDFDVVGLAKTVVRAA